MTVGDLIGELLQQDPSQRVVVRGYESGYDDVSGVGMKELAINVHDEWYFGDHGDAEDHEGAVAEKCVIIG